MGKKYYCESCGKPVPETAHSCPFCGKNFTSVKCPVCGFSGNEKDFADGCPGCGYLSDPKGNKPSADIEKPVTRNRISWFQKLSPLATGIITLALLGVLAILLLVFFKL